MSTKIKLSEKQINELTIQVSGNFLTECLPSNWEDMEDKEFYEWIDDHAWQPFEYWEAKDVFDCISSATYTAQRFIEGLTYE